MGGPTSTSSAASRRLTIGTVAQRSGFSVQSLRFYERRGLLTPSGRWT
ncbi:MAG: MerR family DNA-binding transcriptional regulator [Candidatus Rokubacteria bacterium]|nr:MerR family DNA-binding transcriptional regulator [Candidatus Rokubacteria bacterium]